jgi:hypothetical protein
MRRTPLTSAIAVEPETRVTVGLELPLHFSVTSLKPPDIMKLRLLRLG